MWLPSLTYQQYNYILGYVAMTLECYLPGTFKISVYFIIVHSATCLLLIKQGKK